MSYKLEINNASKNQETYFIDVLAYNGDTRIGHTTTIVSDVGSGENAVDDGWMLVTSQQNVEEEVTCKIDKVR